MNKQQRVENEVHRANFSDYEEVAASLGFDDALQPRDFGKAVPQRGSYGVILSTRHIICVWYSELSDTRSLK